jgi:ATPase subunit of ABC transporter with duplicated ATPase domains
MSSQYIYSMYKLSRTHPPDKQVLKDISLSFFPGAKIGVLGLNGAGKSTLLRIMAARDTEYRGEAQLAPGATVGMLEQEPQLDEGKDVRGNVEDGVAETRALLERRARCSTASTSSPPTTPTRPPTSSRGSRIGSTRPTRGTSTRSSTRRWTRCGCRRRTRT